ncbi:hypothetical protein M422DRAFT_780409 [Sphaerobolus stellatus SS14]|uniref:Uncharacterized protein n=1 Tax=Sphaerobolus stellatus (strain SS14) TaxID=990650 RepID=A0A0C9VS65_SPHS4|nr:hypothetical protein M422DRAFT_780409 [Sphaerobolus stellatus SS14]
MDPDGPSDVFKGIFFTSLTGAALGASYGKFRRQKPLALAGMSAVNSGLVALVFFATREYVVAPLLVKLLPFPIYERRREWANARGEKPDSVYPVPVSFHELRYHKIPDTALAGGMTGALLNVMRRGPAGIIPGVITAGLFSSVIQFIWNEANVIRIKYVSEHKGIQHPFGNDVPERTFSENILDGIGKVFPLKRITDEQYLARLVKEREEVLRRMEEVERELEELENLEKDNIVDNP